MALDVHQYLHIFSFGLTSVGFQCYGCWVLNSNHCSVRPLPLSKSVMWEGHQPIKLTWALGCRNSPCSLSLLLLQLAPTLHYPAVVCVGSSFHNLFLFHVSFPVWSPHWLHFAVQQQATNASCTVKHITGAKGGADTFSLLVKKTLS